MPQFSQPEREEASAATDVQGPLRCATYETREQIVPRRALLITNQPMTAPLVERGRPTVPMMPNDLGVSITP
jgi:hypothetical protein